MWGADAGELRPEGEAGGKDEAAAVGGNYGFLTFLVGFRECIGDVYSNVDFKRPLAAAIGRFEFGQNREREVVVKAGLTTEHQRGIPVSVMGVVWGSTFRLFREYSLLSRDDGRIEGWMEWVESYAVTRCFLPHHDQW